MEFPHLGKQCMEISCKKLDFLPINCDACKKTFCNEHYSYSNHRCTESYYKDNQVPVCPLCNTPIPIARNQLPDFIIGQHIDNNCKSDVAKNRRKVFTNKCSKKGCKTKEMIPVICNECELNFCLKHRHTSDHSCEGKKAAMRQRVLNATLARQTSTNQRTSLIAASIQGNISEDEALARALALSMQQESVPSEDSDYQLARQLQLAESASSNSNNISVNNNSRCNVQ